MNMADNKGTDGGFLIEAKPVKKKAANLLPHIIIALIIVLMLAIFLSTEEEPPVVVSMPDTPAGVRPIGSAIQAAPTSTPSPAQPASVPVKAATKQHVAAGTEAREIIARLRANKADVNYDQVFTRAEQFKAETKLTDAHLLYYYAARNDHAAAAMVLATMYDPDYHSELTSIMDKPDLSQAYKWYQRAAKAGNVMAKAHLNDLRIRVELAATDGNDEAKQLLLRWR
ncbi:hypothetical protein MNBD_GAMMA26-951 [hydrothermal vent metagenome]|uniref:Sel1 repeat family protein n=1 Tax=hydrothermal vent metagenome TaxID=652676 RepID=A0A3B1BIX8_9ZZZZ